MSAQKDEIYVWTERIEKCLKTTRDPVKKRQLKQKLHGLHVRLWKLKQTGAGQN